MMHKQNGAPLFPFFILLFSVMLLSACNRSGENSTVSLEVVTGYTGRLTNTVNFNDACLEWSQLTGYQVLNHSAVYDEALKEKILRDFETYSEPDVLYFFVGADANPFIEAGKVISIAEIREFYPDYAANMDDERIPISQVDGKAYAVPVNGFWEALYVNTEILKEAGVAIPRTNYTWEQFLVDCEAIRLAGYTPIAAALGHIPHYWWEYMIFNQSAWGTHLEIPNHVSSRQGMVWMRGMREIQFLYDAGYFPAETLTMIDEESFQMFVRGQAAFLLDGSWRLDHITSAFLEVPGDTTTLDEEALNKFDVTFVPTMGNRRATDLIGGLSMGYYISKKAWNNPEKRDAAIHFIMYMTSTEVVHRFAQHTATALIDEPDISASAEFNSLQTKAMQMVSQVTTYTEAVQDTFQGKCREPIFEGLADILVGDTDIISAIGASLELYAETVSPGGDALGVE